MLLLAFFITFFSTSVFVKKVLPEWPPELFKDSNDSNVGGRKRHRELCSPDVVNRRSSVVRPLVLKFIESRFV